LKLIGRVQPGDSGGFCALLAIAIDGCGLTECYRREKNKPKNRDLFHCFSISPTVTTVRLDFSTSKEIARFGHTAFEHVTRKNALAVHGS
jgi:hypothetical protein